MSKTAEEMAEEYLDQDKVACAAINRDAEDLVKDAFIAGYMAAQEQYCEAVKVLEKHKAAAEKAVSNIKNAGDWVTIERLEGNSLDPIINLPTPAKWISVKDRLPEYTPMVLAMCTDGYELAYYGMYGQGWTNTLGTEHLNVTHWQALPAPPKEDK